MSLITTSWPRSAKHAPVTRPTQPAPKIPIFTGPISPAGSLATHRPEPPRDREHCLVRERVQQRVHDPVARAAAPQHHHVQGGGVVVEVVMPPANRLAEAPVGEDRRGLPVGLLDAPLPLSPPAGRQPDPPA